MADLYTITLGGQVPRAYQRDMPVAWDGQTYEAHKLDYQARGNLYRCSI